MTVESSNHKEQISKNLLYLGAIPTGCLGAGLFICGCSWSGWWLVLLAQGKSAAELPDPIYLVFPILMVPAGVVSLVLLVMFLRGNRTVAIMGAIGYILFGLLGSIYLFFADTITRQYLGIPIRVLSFTLLISGIALTINQWLRR